MSDFDDQLNRLKAALSLSEDQDVADLLGMTKAAFSARKSRGSFPVDKLKALAADKPQLRLDVKYVLTGVSDELERRLAAVGTATRIAGKAGSRTSRRAVQQAAFEAMVESLSADEQQLVHYFRGADDRGRALLLATGATVARYDQVPAKKPARKKT